MSTIRDTISSFHHYFEDRSGRPSDDLSATPSLIYYWLNIYRQDELEKLKNSGKLLNEGSFQVIPCVELIVIDSVEAPFVPATGCYFLRSKYPLPAMKDGIPYSVTTVDPTCHNCDNETKEFTFVQWNKFQYKINSRIEHQSEALYYTVKNAGEETYLYIYSNSKYDMLKAAAVSLIARDPLDVLSFPECGNLKITPCSFLDHRFLIEQEIESRVFERTFTSLKGFQNGSLADNLPNGNNDTNPSNPPVTNK